MSKKVNCIMLIDDNVDDNFLHERVIKKNNSANKIIVKQNAAEALEFLKSKQEHKSEHPDIIFLDINMPGMNGWEFLEEYNKLSKDLQSSVVTVMLTMSDSSDDQSKARGISAVCAFKTKPLTSEILDDIISKYFPE